MSNTGELGEKTITTHSLAFTWSRVNAAKQSGKKAAHNPYKGGIIISALSLKLEIFSNGR
jgi:hypothetical protein